MTIFLAVWVQNKEMCFNNWFRNLGIQKQTNVHIMLKYILQRPRKALWQFAITKSLNCQKTYYLETDHPTEDVGINN